MSKCPVESSSTPPDSECPVDHSTRSIWSKIFSSSSPTPSTPQHSQEHTIPHSDLPGLSSSRQISSIPRHENSLPDDSNKRKNWVYPSESQFFQAMARKNHKPQEADMKTIVPIHNAVNERAWMHIQEWEEGRGGGRQCGGSRLVSFTGRPEERTPKARWKMLLGYSAPFDRHDWIVDRCGTQVRYVIDFYTGRTVPGQVSFYLDVRPALDNWEGIKMRTDMLWRRMWPKSPQST